MLLSKPHRNSALNNELTAWLHQTSYHVINAPRLTDTYHA